MAKRVSVDRWMFTVTLLLVFVGLVMVFSSSAVMAKEKYGSPYSFLVKQAVWAFAGIAFMLVGMKVDYRRLKHPAVVFCLLGSTTLMLISVFFLDRAHNTHRWIHWGGGEMDISVTLWGLIVALLVFRRAATDIWKQIVSNGPGWRLAALLVLVALLFARDPELRALLFFSSTSRSFSMRSISD